MHYSLLECFTGCEYMFLYIQAKFHIIFYIFIYIQSKFYVIKRSNFLVLKLNLVLKSLEKLWNMKLPKTWHMTGLLSFFLAPLSSLVAFPGAVTIAARWLSPHERFAGAEMSPSPCSPPATPALPFHLLFLQHFPITVWFSRRKGRFGERNHLTVGYRLQILFVSELGPCG